MKKRILTSAIAIVAAMSLSTAAFAVAPGSSNGSQDAQAEVKAGEATEIKSDGGLVVDVPADAFGETVTTVKMEAEVTADPANAPTATIEAVADVTVKVNTKLEITLKDQDGKEIQPGKAVTVTVVYDGVSNIVAYVNGDKVEFIALKVADDKKTASFETTHFSDYYLVQVADDQVEALVGKSGSADAAGDTNNGSDDNKGTGFVLAIVPAAVAAAAVVVSKKRK